MFGSFEQLIGARARQEQADQETELFGVNGLQGDLQEDASLLANPAEQHLGAGFSRASSGCAPVAQPQMQSTPHGAYHTHLLPPRMQKAAGWALLAPGRSRQGGSWRTAMAVQQWRPTDSWRAHHEWLSVASAQRHRTNDGRSVLLAIIHPNLELCTVCSKVFTQQFPACQAAQHAAEAA